MSSIQRKIWESKIKNLPEDMSTSSSGAKGVSSYTGGIAGMANDDNPITPGMKPGKGGKNGKGPVITSMWNAEKEKFEKVKTVSWQVKASFDSASSLIAPVVTNPGLLNTAPAIGKMFAKQVQTALATQDDVQAGVDLLANSIAAHLGPDHKVEVIRGKRGDIPVIAGLDGPDEPDEPDEYEPVPDITAPTKPIPDFPGIPGLVPNPEKDPDKIWPRGPEWPFKPGFTKPDPTDPFNPNIQPEGSPPGKPNIGSDPDGTLYEYPPGSGIYWIWNNGRWVRAPKNPGYGPNSPDPPTPPDKPTRIPSPWKILPWLPTNIPGYFPPGFYEPWEPDEKESDTAGSTQVTVISIELPGPPPMVFVIDDKTGNMTFA